MAETQRRKSAKRGGRTARRRLDPDDRRGELLDAAFAVMKKLGPDACRVEDITRAARAAKGTFYLYFPSWTDLLAAMREKLLADYAAALRARFAAAELSWDLIEGECIRFVDYVVGLGRLHEAIFHGPEQSRSGSKTHSAPAQIAGMLAGGISAGVVRPLDPQRAAPLVFAVLHMTADEIAAGGRRAERLDMLRDLLREWLCAPSERMKF